MEEWNKGYRYPDTDKFTDTKQSISGFKSLFNQCYKSAKDEGKVGFLQRFCGVLKTNFGDIMMELDKKSDKSDNNLNEIYENHCQDID